MWGEVGDADVRCEGGGEGGKGGPGLLGGVSGVEDEGG